MILILELVIRKALNDIDTAENHEQLKIRAILNWNEILQPFGVCGVQRVGEGVLVTLTPRCNHGSR